MEKRHSSPSPKAEGPRPRTHRKRSNSVPLVEALGCSTPEAELILAEGRAAVRSRHASKQRRGRRHRSEDDDVPTFRPKNHLKYLNLTQDKAAAPEETKEYTSADVRRNIHTRIPSDATDRSGSTVTGPAAPAALIGDEQRPRTSPSSPLGNYSATLAQFIQGQLASIPSYDPMLYLRSCPDLRSQAKSPLQSPTKQDQRSTLGSVKVIEIPPIRPPMRSAFSAWSSTDDEAELEDVPQLPTSDPPRKDLKTSNSTPSILRYYGESSDGSFLFSSTPSETGESLRHPNADGFSFPARSTPPAQTSEDEPSPKDDYDYPSSAISTHPQLSSSAPSFSSSSTASYFDYEQPITITDEIRNKIIAAVSPHPSKRKILTATSPFEGTALANVHDILVESKHRVLVDGLSFDLIRGLSMPEDSLEASHRVAPC